MEIRHITVGDLVTNCYLVSCDKDLAIIDPGGDYDRILNEISKTGLNVKYIIATHWHPDHTCCCEDLRAKTGAELLIHRLEKDYIEFVPDKLLEHNSIVQIGKCDLKVVHTPGHTKGSICLIGKDIVFTGDLLFIDGYGRTDLPGGSKEDMKKSLETISGIIKPGVTVYPGHGEIFKATK